MDWYRPARPPSHTLPLPGEEEPGPKGAVRGGYSPIPRRDARAGEVEMELVPLKNTKAV